MQYDEEKFRLQFQEFADPVAYPSIMIELYWDLASAFIDTVDCPFRMLNGKALVAAVNMLAAHLLIIGQRQGAGPNGSGTPGGEQGGFETSATVGDVSVAKLAPPAKDGWEWWLASTPYGQMLWALLGIIGVGGTSIGGLPEREAFRKVGGAFF